MNFSEIIGKKVICTGGYILGEVKGAEVDLKTWFVTQLSLKLTDTAANELGFKKRFRSSTIKMPIKFVQAVGDVITIYPSLKTLSESSEITGY